MEVRQIPISELEPAAWNSNFMKPEMLIRLRRSIETFGFLEPLVVRRNGDIYEVIGGSHRLAVLKESDLEKVPCVVIKADDATVMLMSQSLNNIEGEEDPVRRGALLKRVLEKFSPEHVLDYLPESADSLTELVSFGSESMTDYVNLREKRKSARLHHLTFQLTTDQLQTVEAAISLVPAEDSANGNNPNRRSNALGFICEEFISARGPL